MWKWIALTGFLALAGCVGPERQAAQDAAQMQLDQTECQKLGFTQGTEGFANCLLKLKEIRAEEANTDEMRRANTPRPWGPWGPYGPYGRPYSPYW